MHINNYNYYQFCIVLILTKLILIILTILLLISSDFD
jgi:hypothetical protein